ncbi:MAG: MFS transporter, partial [Peptococcales bacterium]
MNKALLKIVVLSVSLIPMSVMAVSSALADISMAFPDASQNTITLIISLPSLLMIPFALLCGKISNKMSRRSLLFMSLFLFFVGGVGPAFVNDLTSILIFRGILGIAMGFIMPIASGLIADFYEGSERALMMGWQSAVINIGAIVSSLIAGFLCTINWNYSFLVYFMTLFVLLLTFFKLPEPQIQKTEIKKENQKLGLPVYVISLLALCYVLLNFTFFTDIAMVITGENLGDAAAAGVALTIMTVGGLIAGLIFGKVNDFLKDFTVVLGVGLTGAGFLLMSYPMGYNAILLESLIIGIGFGTTMPWIMTRVASLVPQDQALYALSIVSSFLSLG